MPQVHGKLKSNKLVLQGHGILGEDITMGVKHDAFNMTMGDDILLTISRDDIENQEDASMMT